jgi:hypothetical protein
MVQLPSSSAVANGKMPVKSSMVIHYFLPMMETLAIESRDI